MDYKKEIVELLNTIDNIEFLEYVYRFVKRLKKNWGI